MQTQYVVSIARKEPPKRVALAFVEGYLLPIRGMSQNWRIYAL